MCWHWLLTLQKIPAGWLWMLNKISPLILHSLYRVPLVHVLLLQCFLLSCLFFISLFLLASFLVHFRPVSPRGCHLFSFLSTHFLSFSIIIFHIVFTEFCPFLCQDSEITIQTCYGRPIVGKGAWNVWSVTHYILYYSLKYYIYIDICTYINNIFNTY